MMSSRDESSTNSHTPIDSIKKLGTKNIQLENVNSNVTLDALKKKCPPLCVLGVFRDVYGVETSNRKKDAIKRRDRNRCKHC